MDYHINGVINSILVLVSALGIFFQLQTLLRRKQQNITSDSLPGSHSGVTALLSLNQFNASFWAYFSFMVFGIAIHDFDHYLVWPRLLACLLLLAILHQIWLDRKSRLCHRVLILSMSAFMTVMVLLWLRVYLYGFESMDIFPKLASLASWLVVLVTVFLAQGYLHQIWIIIKQGDTGAIDIRMSQFILVKDMSTMALSVSMGLSQAWPLFCLAVTSATTKLIIMYLFRWVRLSRAC